MLTVTIKHAPSAKGALANDSQNSSLRHYGSEFSGHDAIYYFDLAVLLSEGTFGFWSWRVDFWLTESLGHHEATGHIVDELYQVSL